jgi:hypothetical protein
MELQNTLHTWNLFLANEKSMFKNATLLLLVDK